MLSFISGEKIARVVYDDKKKSDKYIYLKTDDKINLSKEFFDKYSKLPKKHLSILKKSLKQNKEPEECKIKKIYQDAKQDIEKSFKRSIEIIGGKIQAIPRKSVVEKIYVSGPSGSGKSYFMGNWMKEYKKIWKDDPVYVLSSVQSDPVLDKNDPIRISKEEVLEMTFVDEDFEKSLVVFDDTFSIGDKIIRKKINYMIDALLETGRHYDTRMLISSHLFSTPYTRRIICESTSVVIYPNTGGGIYHIEKFLKIYCGFKKQQIEKILNLKSRWVLIQRWAPIYVMHEHGIYMM